MMHFIIITGKKFRALALRNYKIIAKTNDGSRLSIPEQKKRQFCCILRAESDETYFFR